MASAGGATRNYHVRAIARGWAVELSDAVLAVFDDAEQAVDYACRAARGDAAHDHLALVSAETAPREFHCFMPSSDSARPYLRLLAGGAG